MKKMLATFILISYAIIVVCSGMPLTASASVADEDTRLEQKMRESYMVYYFNNLVDYYEYNFTGGCGLISLEMLLTYYESFWDDNLVDDSYIITTSNWANSPIAENYLSMSSPGAKSVLTSDEYNYFLQETLAILQNTSTKTKMELWAEYSTLLQSRQDISLMGKLIAVNSTIPESGEEEDGFQYHINANGALTLSGIYHTLRQYLITRNTENPQVSLNDWLVLYENYSRGTEYLEPYISPEGSTSTNITNADYLRSKVIEHVSNGIPVIVALKYLSNEGETIEHAAVAYDFDGTNLYIHAGERLMDESYVHISCAELSNNPVYIMGYVALMPTIALHNHSDNYYFYSEGGYVCTCALPNHQHKYTYANYSLNSHKLTCYCGYSEIQNHVFAAYGLTQIKCIHCGFIKNSGPDTPVVSPLAIPIQGNLTDNKENEYEKE